VGLSAETRNAAFIWAAIPLGLTLIWVPLKKYWPGFIAIGVGCLLTIAYPLYGNWRDFGELNPTTVDSFYAKEFFQGALLTRLPPFTYVYPVEDQIMWSEYYSEYDPGRTTAGRAAMAQKYFDKGWALIWKDPVRYIRSCLNKTWYVWQKENVFFYQEPGFNDHWKYTYAVNVGILVLTLVGLWFALRRDWRKLPPAGKWTVSGIIGTILYGTFAFSVSHAEYRLTIPFYGLLILSAAYGLSALVRRVTIKV
jgi:hypothetical protein